MKFYKSPQEVSQLVGTTPNEAEITGSNPSPPFVRICQKKKKHIKKIQ
jgi:hypothetical protein